MSGFATLEDTLNSIRINGMDLLKTSDNIHDDVAKLQHSYNLKAREIKKSVTSFFENLEYDGIVMKNDRGLVTTFVFNPNQIKSADPVTYDDEGNVIPLSKRFDSSKDDIRY